MIGTLVFLTMLAPQTAAPDLSNTLSWRCIGPFRGGRTVGACGVPQQPYTFYIGVNNGGVWKTTDAGRTWKPIFDDQPTGSIGDVMVAPSNPNIIYVGSGEGLRRPDLSTGDGMYRSDNAGKTWRHIGLRDAKQIGGICVDSKNPNRVFVASVGHPYGPNVERGVFRTLNGGKSWKRVLGQGVDAGAIQVTIDPNNPKVVFADMWESRHGPWENGQWSGPGSGMFKSVDGGDSWKKLGGGLPTFEQGLGRIGFAIAPSNSNVLYACVDSGNLSGIYRSNNGGGNWKRVNQERRLLSRGDDFAEVKVHPKNPEIIFVGDTSFYRSNDGGKNFVCIKGSPGGDDYHRAWINPNNPDIILTAADQGAAVTLNGGDTWSSWYNQPTAQMFHCATDNLVPYNVYGGQQESGSAMVSSRGNDGQIAFREWHPAGGDEYCYLAPDPLNPRYVFGARVNRYDKITHEIVNVRPTVAHRTVRTAPLLFSKADPTALYYAGNLLFRTKDGGKNWETLSPDLSRERINSIPESVGKYTTPDMKSMARRGVIYTIAPSPRDSKVIWCGTDDGLFWVSNNDGKNWEDVTRGVLSPWSKVSIMDAGNFDTETCYAAVNRIRCNDYQPHIYKTHDGGRTWQKIVNGLPEGPVNVVREDPKRPGLLFCGTELGVYYSFNDGGNWQPLRINMPATSIRDLVIQGSDLVVATHGRSFWILDNYSLLRNYDVGSSMNLEMFPIEPAYLFERNRNSDTPLPQDEPVGQNPPDGAMIDFSLPSNVKTSKIEMLDSFGVVVRTFDSANPPKPVDPKAITVMEGWAMKPWKLGTTKGIHRFVWDLRSEPPAGGGGRGGLPISAVWGRTPYSAQGAMVAPGTYTVRITAENENGIKVVTGTVQVLADPRK
jgi:photosystem II stability/assembly factor-like uncharacterized protein